MHRTNQAQGSSSRNLNLGASRVETSAISVVGSKLRPMRRRPAIAASTQESQQLGSSNECVTGGFEGNFECAVKHDRNSAASLSSRRKALGHMQYRYILPV